MASKTVNQFKALFPASATPSKLLAEKFSIELKVLSDWGDCTLNDLKKLVGQFGIFDKLVRFKPDQQGTATVCMCYNTVASETGGRGGFVPPHFSKRGGRAPSL